jgi:SAM-dependent methyltransferase
LLLQCLAFLLTVLGVSLIELGLHLQVSIATAALLQGVLAALLSRWRRMATWWFAIQLLFPIALVLTLAARLPPAVFLILFLVFLVLYWSTFRTQVPYYPSTLTVWRTVADLLPAGRPVKAVDIGSGFGGLAMYLAALREDGIFLGIEIAPLPWVISALRARLARSRARFMLGDYERLHFGEYDAVFAYLSPAAMPALWEKAHSEMRKGSLLLSYEFPVPGHAPDLVVQPTASGPALYGWRF